MTNDNQTSIDGQNKSAIDAATVGGGNGSSESMLQTQFGSGLPHGNQSVPGAASVGLLPEKFGGNGFK
ncbi:unnamed protein product, partial [Brassica rapa subsp. narinosa]